jgi:hypothetical protein
MMRKSLEKIRTLKKSFIFIKRLREDERKARRMEKEKKESLRFSVPESLATFRCRKTLDDCLWKTTRSHPAA